MKQEGAKQILNALGTYISTLKTGTHHGLGRGRALLVKLSSLAFKGGGKPSFSFYVEKYLFGKDFLRYLETTEMDFQAYSGTVSYQCSFASFLLPLRERNVQFRNHHVPLGLASLSMDLLPAVLTNCGFRTHCARSTWFPGCNRKCVSVRTGRCSEMRRDCMCLRRRVWGLWNVLLVFRKNTGSHGLPASQNISGCDQRASPITSGGPISVPPQFGIHRGSRNSRGWCGDQNKLKIDVKLPTKR